MIIRQLKEEQFEQFQHVLNRKAHMAPLEASYTLRMTIDGADYVIRIQPERHNKIAVLQALRIQRTQCPRALSSSQEARCYLPCLNS